MWHLVVLLLLVCVASRFRRDAGGALLPSPTSAPVLRRFWLTTILHPFPVRRIYRTENQLSTRCEDVALSQRKRKKMTINISCAKNVSTAVLDSLARDCDVYFVGLVNSEVGLSAAPHPRIMSYTLRPTKVYFLRYARSNQTCMSMISCHCLFALRSRLRSS